MAPDPVIKQESDQSLSLNVGGHVYTTKLEYVIAWSPHALLTPRSRPPAERLTRLDHARWLPS